MLVHSQQERMGQPIREPLYGLEIMPRPPEAELLASAPVRRLKLLHHYGASALCTPVTHSRFEHTVGVWALAAHFFPDDEELRVCAIVHDVGHLPFSHAAEMPLGLNHHRLTEAIIESGEIANILSKHGIDPKRIVAKLNEDSPLTNRSGLLGLDHLDSFLRDTQAAFGGIDSAGIVRRIRFNGPFVEADPQTAVAILKAIAADQSLFLSAPLLAMDALLARSIQAHAEKHPKFRRRVSSMTDHELLAALERSDVGQTRRLLHTLLWKPHRIRVLTGPEEGSIHVGVRKLYTNQPLIAGRPSSETNGEAAALLSGLAQLTRTYEIGWQ